MPERQTTSLTKTGEGQKKQISTHKKLDERS